MFRDREGASTGKGASSVGTFNSVPRLLPKAFVAATASSDLHSNRFVKFFKPQQFLQAHLTFRPNRVL